MSTLAPGWILLHSFLACQICPLSWECLVMCTQTEGPSFMSNELKDWLHSKGFATSRTTPYNPEGNGQTERYNGIVMKTITLALKSRNLSTKFWQTVLPDALHSIRSLINTTTNETPHERMFKFVRRSSTGHAVPSWLTNSKKVLLKRFVRHSKYDPLVDEVELIESNPLYAHIRYNDMLKSCIKAEEKWKEYYPNHYDENEYYNLTYESGIVIENIPGTSELLEDIKKNWARTIKG